MRLRAVLLNSLLILLSVLVTYLLLETGYRLLTYQQLSSKDESYAFWWTDQVFYELDETAGYRYPADTTLRHTLTDFMNASVVGHDVYINNMGNLSRYDDLPPDMPGVYRIALIGDSFTAGAFSGMPPGDFLEPMLNESAAFKAMVGADTIDVMNYALEAIGFEQFAAIYESRVQPVAPDLLIVAFISDDIRRRFIWRDAITIDHDEQSYQLHLTCYGLPAIPENPACHYTTPIFPQQQGGDDAWLDRLRDDLYDSDLARRPWLRLYPELLAQTIGYRWGWLPGLMNDHPAWSHYQADSQSLDRAGAALDRILSQQPETLLLHVPVHTEILSGTIDSLAELFMSERRDMNVLRLMDYLPPVDDETVRGWYNLPFDGHFNDRGTEQYARALRTILQQSLAP